MDFIEKFIYINFEEGRGTWLLNGAIFSIKATLMAAVIGLFLGILIALFNLSDDYFKNSKFRNFAKYNIFSKIAKAYIYIVRGTPVIVQLVFFNNVIFVDNLSKVPILNIAAIVFGLNSAAYIAEIVRSGIQSIDKGQLEATKALGMPYGMGMKYVVLPQAIKNMLPAFVNEFIVLLKETSIIGLLGGDDLYKASKRISSITFNGTMPLIAIALIYLALTTIFTIIMNLVERRVKKSD